jgi:hypothetical protein
VTIWTISGEMGRSEVSVEDLQVQVSGSDCRNQCRVRLEVRNEDSYGNFEALVRGE